MFGNNEKLPPEISSGEELKVTSVFRTFQGEGPYAGCPAIFIRLSGCNLACSFCDTEFDSFTLIAISDLIKEVERLSQNQVKLVVITGGEPFRQTLLPLTQALVNFGYRVQIESNGTLYNQIPQEVEVVLSPKVSNGKYHQLRPDILAHTIALKFLISENNKEYSNIPDLSTLLPAPIYLQPMDEYCPQKNKQNEKLVIELATRYGCNIGMQIHKHFGID